MANFVLVAGAWQGGWSWKNVTPLLQQAGHTVYPATLTGLGDRVHLGTPETNLDTHIQDVVNLLEYEDLRDVRLVGHSYAGLVVTGVAEKVPDRLGKLIYLDAILPEDGQNIYDINGPLYEQIVEQDAAEKGDGWRWPLPAYEVLSQFLRIDDMSEEVLQWFREKSVGQPVGSYRQKLSVKNPAARQVPRAYIRCTRTEAESYGQEPPYLAKVRNNPAWQYLELESTHFAMLAHPRELAELLLKLAD